MDMQTARIIARTIAQDCSERQAMYQVIVDGIEWKDADGMTEWPLREANALADMPDGLDYFTVVVPV